MSTPVFDDLNYTSMAQQEADKNLRVAFHMVAVQNHHKSKEEGRPIFQDVPHITILTPGSRDTFVGEATESYQQRFPQQWARFIAGQEQSAPGTPLSELSWLTQSQVAEMKAQNITSVEQLAGLADVHAQKMMGNFEIRNRAKRWLEASQGEAVYSRLEARLDKLEDELEEKDKVIEAQKAEIERLKKVPVKA